MIKLPLIMAGGALLYRGFEAATEALKVAWQEPSQEAWLLVLVLVMVNAIGLEAYRYLIRYLTKGDI